MKGQYLNFVSFKFTDV